MRTSQFINELTLFMETNRQRLYQYACYSCGDPDTAADILQDVYLRLCEKSSLHQGVGNLAAYVFRTLARECSRRPARRYEPLSDTFMASDAEPETFDEEYRRINSLLGMLPE